MIDIWETIVSGPGAVIHGTATLFTAWKRVGIKWRCAGSFWSRTEAVSAAEALSLAAVTVQSRPCARWRRGASSGGRSI
jgi:hypothetical protein